MVGVPVSNQDRYVQNTVVQSRDAAISYLRPAYGGSSVLTMPTTVNLADSPGYFGPNLLMTTLPIPERATDALMLAGLVVIGLAAQRRSH